MCDHAKGVYVQYLVHLFNEARRRFIRLFWDIDQDYRQTHVQGNDAASVTPVALAESETRHGEPVHAAVHLRRIAVRPGRVIAARRVNAARRVSARTQQLGADILKLVVLHAPPERISVGSGQFAAPIG